VGKLARSSKVGIVGTTPSVCDGVVDDAKDVEAVGVARRRSCRTCGVVMVEAEPEEAVGDWRRLRRDHDDGRVCPPWTDPEEEVEVGYVLGSRNLDGGGPSGLLLALGGVGGEDIIEGLGGEDGAGGAVGGGLPGDDELGDFAA